MAMAMARCAWTHIHGKYVVKDAQTLDKRLSNHYIFKKKRRTIAKYGKYM
jgi:hypothetical protein